MLDAKLGDEIAKSPASSRSIRGLVDFTSMEELGADGVMVQGWEADSPLMKTLDILPGGRYLKADDEHCVLLGEGLAVALGKARRRQNTAVRQRELHRGRHLQQSHGYENRSMVMLLSDLQRFMGRKGQVNGFAVMVDHPDDEAEVQRICNEIEALGPANRRQVDRRVRSSSTTEIRFIRAMAWITSAVAIIIGAVGMLNTMIMSVFERTREIGILRAIGWRTLRIVRMILVESILLSLTGGVVGIARGDRR